VGETPTIDSGRVDDPRQTDFLGAFPEVPKVNGRDIPRTNGHDVADIPSEPEIEPPRVVDPREPLTIAKLFAQDRHTQDGLRTLLHHQDSFMSWGGTHYADLPREQVRGQIYDFLEPMLIEGKKGELQPFRPTTRKVNDVLDALRSVAQVHGHVAAPAWLDSPPFPAREVIACANGLLHLPTGRLIPHSPNFYCTSALGYAYDPAAPEPAEWLNFIDSIWPDDIEARETLQDMFGYYLGNDTDQQKIPLIVGPKRSGKGTIARAVTAMLGQDSVVYPTLTTLAGPFGSESLIDKKLAIVADARISGRADTQVMAERLLSISGEDSQTVDRKNKTAWSGRLPTRFLLMSNELPQIGDASGALSGRFIVLTMTVSWFGREDRGLTDRIMRELPGILNWSIAGWKRLRARGHFVQPDSSQEAIQELEELSSPITAFLREHCLIEPGRTVGVDSLFEVWKKWCTDQNREHPGNKASFGKQLRAALPWLTKPKQEGSRGDRERMYEGIGLKPYHYQDGNSDGFNDL